jgi:hypothetical protein
MLSMDTWRMNVGCKIASRPKIPGLGDAEPSLSRYVAFFK